jgi:glycine/D-amino acid oxidase-like deaminating enzyme
VTIDRADEADWGAAPWQIDLDLPQAPLPERTEIAVIGAGFTGLAAAYHLARRGRRVDVFEAGRVGSGASGRTGGLALEGTARGPLPGVEHCLEELAAVTAQAGIECDLDLRGCWEIAHAREPSASGIRWRDGDRVLRIEQSVPGGTVDPGKLVAGLARAANAAGATIHEHAPVRHVDVDAAPRLAFDDGQVCAAERVVVALNGYTATLLRLPIDLRAPLTLAVCTAAVDDALLETIGLGARIPFYTSDLPYLWGRCAPGGRLILGAGLVFADDDDPRRVDIRSPECSATLSRLEERVHGLHPALAGVEITHRWGGPIAFRARTAPLLASLPERPRVIVAGAYAGHGVALSIRIGRLIADAIVDGTELPKWGAIEA